MATRSSPSRRRLTPQQRRDELLDIGTAMFGAQPYEDVSMEGVAERAGVSRALLYHYFPNKRDFFAAIYQRAADRLLDASQLDPDVSITQQVSAALDAHIDYFAANSNIILVANRGPMATDPVVQRIIADELMELRDRMLDVSGLHGHPRALASATLHAWLEFVRVMSVEWLQHNAIDRTELRDTCLRALIGALNVDLS